MTAPSGASEDPLVTIVEVARLSGSMNPVPPGQPKKQQYTYRLNPRTYDAAKAKAESRGETVVDVIRRALERYVEDD